ncbi:MAG: FAD-dependent oxidoreductase, partial [Halobacteriales archaeon]|nr:FAD-dependent oxidoreductase [Halobacteriales archaeon]
MGGLLHPFIRKGYEFVPGLHYVGQCGPGGPFAMELEQLGLSCKNLFAPMDDDFDIFEFPDFEFAMCVGVDHYRDRLAAAFPGDVRGVERVMGAVEHLLAAQRLGTPGRHAMADYFSAAGAISLVRWLRASFREFLEWACEEEKLRMVLAASCGDYGLPPASASAAYGLAVLAHYIGGAYYPRGGVGRFKDALMDTCTDAGVQFRTSTPIEAIEVNDGRVVGVVTGEGERVEVDGLVTAIDPRHVYGSMLPSEYFPTRYERRTRTMRSSISACCLYLGLGQDLREHGWGAHNRWVYPSWDLDREYGTVIAGEFPEHLSMFISPNSLKDPTGSMAPPGGTTVEVVVPSPWQKFARWENTLPEERGADYEELVARLKRKIVGELETRHPELVADVHVCELSTPLAFRHHMNAIDGGLYGPAHMPDQ